MDKLIRPLTPHEVRALQKPAVQDAVRLINDSLLRGRRQYRINTPLVADIVAVMRSSGWDATAMDYGHVDSLCGMNSLVFSELDDAATAEAIGAELTGQAMSARTKGD